ncbi:Nramp family divalent metal transporter [Maribellus sediminis]|uniref:Nramp family divalent metal transporter n=1 Tax=Maribellus sediminis TaxID=2696285 RepID=UPI001430CCAF|nr:Nramp family divalent metal transporter [Maribellus sediminis]
MSAKKRLLNIIFWSIVSAAFIGPGTITTAAKSGAAFGAELLWALLFSTLACLLLQEAAARLTIISGKNLGQAIVQQFENSTAKIPILILVLGAIVVGAAAYEMGNLLGAVAGFRLILDLPAWILVLIIGAVAALILSIPSLKVISTIMGFAVVLMGLGFLIVAVLIKPEISAVLKGTFVPRVPKSTEAGILVLGLIGTTIVPYNLFLGSGISSNKQSVGDMRFGLAVAILLGGLFSMAVLIVGTAVLSEFSFESLSLAVQQKIGPAGKYLLGFGLFAAGFTSSVTAPLAAAITLKSLFGNKNPEKWEIGSTNFRLGWLAVLLIGIAFGAVNVKPIPAIILAQALNGFLLPFVSIFLFIVINNKNITGHQSNPLLLNLLMIVVIFVTLILGLNSATKAFYSVFLPNNTPDNTMLWGISVIALLISSWVWVKGQRK